MALFVTMAVGTWVVAMLAWLLLSKAARSSDAQKFKARLAGSTKPAGGGDNKKGPALIETEDHRTGRVVLRLLHRFDLIERLSILLEQAGLKWKVARIAHACLGIFLGSFCFLWYFSTGSIRSFAVIVAAALACTPVLYIIRKRNTRLKKFEELFPDSLEFVARSMRAGHAFSVALEMLQKEFQEPLAGEFRRTFDEHNLGLPLDMALLKLSKRVPSLDVHFFVSAVLLQKRTGGNLAEILDKLAYVIRERFKLRGRIRAVSAHGRMTGIALSAIPAGVAALLFVVNRDYVGFFLNDPAGQMMAGMAIGLQAVGFLIIKKIVAIEV